VCAIARMLALSAVVSACQPYDSPREGTPASACCSGAGICIPTLFAPVEVAERLAQDSCSADALCAPLVLVASEGAAIDSCRAAGDLESRCLPSCLPEVAQRAARLQQRDCDRDQRCVPCYDPLTGADTGACRNRGDQPREAPRTFERCGSTPAAQGFCVPLELLSPAQIDVLPVTGCSPPGTRCVPDTFLASGA
jgi:hypothetical protein